MRVELHVPIKIPKSYIFRLRMRKYKIMRTLITLSMIDCSRSLKVLQIQISDSTFPIIFIIFLR